ncbi:MAG: tRNA (adenosine(37)-N6)-threonylcarbamoyltransferase complex ATPase subunit type 1 TsaE [Methylococcaceae bacterium]|jgi:tRNA threonylcarbamoyladenosine biosynthesis protein TsaE
MAFITVHDVNMQYFLQNAQATEQLGSWLWQRLPSQALVFLQGDLGVGKTTLVRGFLRAAGFTGAIKSPTYTLVEEYEMLGRKFYHFDLYRLEDPEELEWIGILDYLVPAAICLIEWPSKGQGYLPAPDLIIDLSIKNDGRVANLQFSTEK